MCAYSFPRTNSVFRSIWPEAPHPKLHLPAAFSRRRRLPLLLELLKTAKHGAGDATRTRDIKLGRLLLYQLSYTRSCECPNSGQAKTETGVAPCSRSFTATVSRDPRLHRGGCRLSTDGYSPHDTTLIWMRERDSNPRPTAYETVELPDCSIPRQKLLPTTRVVKNWRKDRDSNPGDPCESLAFQASAFSHSAIFPNACMKHTENLNDRTCALARYPTLSGCMAAQPAGHIQNNET